MRGDVTINFKTESEAASTQAVDALLKAGFVAIAQPRTEGSPIIAVEARAGIGQASPDADYQTRLIEQAKAAVVGIDVEFTGNGIEIGASQPILEAHRVIVPVVPQTARTLDGHPDADTLWNMIRLGGSDPVRFDVLRSGKAGPDDGDWVTYRAFLTQAETYYRGAQGMRGVASALLYYYAFLNLAKAELLTWKPELVSKPIGHGIHSKWEGGFREWSVACDTRGVFPSLYEKRVGVALEPRVRLDLKEAVGRCLEVGFELEESALGSVRASTAYVGVFTNGLVSWAQLLVERYDVIAGSEPARLAVLDMFNEVELFPLRDTQRDFALSSRYLDLAGMQLLWSEESKDVAAGEGRMIFNLKSPDWLAEIQVRLNGIVEPPAFGAEALLLPSIDPTKLVPLPSGLARYASMFFFSSLVRYSPGLLDAIANPNESFFVDAFVRDAPVHMLADFAQHLVAPGLFYYDTSRRS